MAPLFKSIYYELEAINLFEKSYTKCGGATTAPDYFLKDQN